MLQKIEGNPEIVFWNGYVDDFQHISKEIVEEYLTKPSFDIYKLRWEREKQIEAQDLNVQLTDQELEEAKKSYNRNVEWEYNEYVTIEDIESKVYNKKRVLFLSPKTRGKSSWGRGGSLGY